jgi:hypothetical protein
MNMNIYKTIYRNLALFEHYARELYFAFTFNT